jgi:monoamine oxidase
VAGPALQAPTGRIHWAGTETASVFTGYMEGALESAERVFGELHALRA